jgi:hypothetical protein
VDRGDIHDNRDAFFVGGGIYNAGSLTMKASSIRNNASSEDGGGLYNQGTAELSDTNVRDNLAVDGSGGGIDNRNALTMRGGSVSSNISRGLNRGAGGIDNRGTLTLQRTTISGNVTNQSGGGLFTSGTASLDQVTIVLNSANREEDNVGNGGGVYNSGRLLLAHSAVISNTALRSSQGGGLSYTGYGGGLFNASTGAAAVLNTTLSGNQAEESGGGIANQAGAVKLSNVTVTRNRADSDDDESGVGGGIFNDRVTVEPALSCSRARLWQATAT